MECMIDVEKIKQKCCIVDKIKALEMDLKKLNYNAETLPELEQFIKDVDLGIKYMHNFEMYTPSAECLCRRDQASCLLCLSVAICRLAHTQRQFQVLSA